MPSPLPPLRQHTLFKPGQDGLRPSPALLLLLERAACAGSWVLVMPQRGLVWSEPLAKLLGREGSPPLVWADFSDIFAPDWRMRMRSVLSACLDNGTAFDEEAQIVTAAGQRLWVRALGDVVRDHDGTVVQVSGVIRDLTVQKRAEQEALSMTMRLATTLASIHDAFVTVDREGRLTYLNPLSEKLIGKAGAEVLGLPIWEALDSDGVAQLRHNLTAAFGNASHHEFEAFYTNAGKWLELRVYPFDDGLALYLRDVSERRQSQEQLLLLQTSISRLNDLVLITEAGPVDDPGPRIVFVNDAFERHTGYRRDEVMGQTPRLLQGERTQRVELDRIRKALQQAEPVRAELINYKKNGEQFWLELDIVPVDYFSRGLTHWVAVARDITTRKAAEEEIEHLAFYDTLTQLPNRQLLMNSLRQALLPTDNPDRTGALMFIDLDNFKVLNDTRGHAVGDLLLQQVAQRLSSCVRLRDTVARLGGDEFVVLLDDLGDDREAASERARGVAQKILATLCEPCDLAGNEYDGTCSIGVTLVTQHQQSVGELLKQADLAMYQAKAAGRNTICFFDPGMQAVATANAALTRELRQGLRNNEFVLYYQPQVGSVGNMVGVEALLRWNHPQRGLVAPNDFIGQAEESGLILPLGKWVLDTACAQLGLWSQRPETCKFSIAINVSVRQFRHPEFVEQVMAAIASAGISAHRLKLELTESLLANDMDVTIAKMGILKDAGVTLSIDDFGIGYSALSYLKYLPLDQLKIDRAFVKDVLTDPNDAAIARTIIGLAQSLGLGVMAEGVETEAQRNFLARHGCHCFQGYLFSRPLPIDELEAFIAKLQQAPESQTV
ncbi:MAG: EAL domain-containing protein [Polaromonas sp.]|uniref:bifunctional diguanylate cyclase/phosphodiesterase n=1 Tax=Polaromonas sp. TaxID=1869339 RepID=UPI0017F39A29|nr:EAL domain-containing protein [Polaromonas sp.]MBA3592471.1 EAL domain-containing protein [Polaromonas sp.]